MRASESRCFARSAGRHMLTLGVIGGETAEAVTAICGGLVIRMANAAGRGVGREVIRTVMRDVAAPSMHEIVRGETVCGMRRSRMIPVCLRGESRVSAPCGGAFARTSDDAGHCQDTRNGSTKRLLRQLCLHR